MRLVYSKVESVGADEHDPTHLAIRLAAVPGLVNPSLTIARDQVESFLTILDVAKEGDLVGCSVRVTVDDEKGSERINFLTRAKPAKPIEPVAFSPIEPVSVSGAELASGAQAAEQVAAAQAAEPEAVSIVPAAAAEAAQANTAIEPTVSAEATAIEPVAVSAEPLEATQDVPVMTATAPQGVPVMAASELADEVRVYDAGSASTTPAAEEDCADAASLEPAELAAEVQARAVLAAAATAPLDQRFFLYRETYGEGAFQSVVELTPDEFALLGGSAAYLHVEDCAVIASRDLSPDAAKGIERLLGRATSRPDAALPRAELERLSDAGRVVSCAVY